MWENLEESYIVNLYRGMAKLKLKTKVNLLQLLCIVVSVALHIEFERFGGYCIDCSDCYYSNKKETNVESSFSTAPARSDFHPEITV